MAVITFVDHDGSKHVVEVEPGYTLMQAAVDNMLEGIAADCGGACSCATCHCYIDQAWVERVGLVDGIEAEMIKFAVNTRDTSRLSCQLTVTEELDGLVVHLPESQY